MNTTQEIKLVADRDQIRLDRLLREQLGLTQANIEKSLRKKLITLIGSDIKLSNNIRIDQGQEILVRGVKRPPLNPKDSQEDKEVLFKQHLAEHIIYEDNFIIALNKPAGFAVQGGTKVKFSIDCALPAPFKIVHRLDQDTSGVLMIAKGAEVANQLMEKFKGHEIAKSYLAVIRNPLPLSPITLTTNLITGSRISMIPNPPRSFSTKTDSFDLNEDGKMAISYFTQLKVDSNYSLIQAEPKTGRKHQLRAHLNLMGCPVIGDKKYGGAASPQLLLHSHTIWLTLQDKVIKIIAQPPAYFNPYL